MKLLTESDYRAKILFLSFEKPCILKTCADVKKLQAQWFEALKSWHSPYKALLDARNLSIEPQEDLEGEFARLKRLLERFYLRKAVCYGMEGETDLFSFPNYSTEKEAVEILGIREFFTRKVDPSDFRSLIAFDNHFKDSTIELSFLSEVHIKGKKDLQIFKSKLMNNLMLWHSGWHLLIDCSKLRVEESIFDDFLLLQKSLKGFFLKEVIGYNPKSAKETYPFPVYRSRHKAVLEFEKAGTGEGDVANCSSRK